VSTEKKKILTTTETSEYINGKVKPETLVKWRRLGKGPKFLKLGRNVGYLVEDVDQWLHDECLQIA
jgi:predicted DNA-binding transcriptional regulator AlpA